MNQYLGILTMGVCLEIVILIGILVLTVNFKVWASKRDKFYVSKLTECMKKIEDIEKNYANEFLEILKQNKEVLNTIKKQVKIK